jgi:hypothetical protein
MNLQFKRKLYSRSEKNRGALVCLPRAIAQAWQGFDTILMVFDGTNLILTPQGNNNGKIYN